MTKKTFTVYGILFLCAFAFGLSFTMASSAQAANCCTKWCDDYPWVRDYEGQWFGECIYTNYEGCPREVYFCPTDN